jgi:hypothetical protein
MTYPISTSSLGLFLYLSDWNGGHVAFMSDAPILVGEGPFKMLDFQLVEHKGEAKNWFQGRLNNGYTETTEDTSYSTPN